MAFNTVLFVFCFLPASLAVYWLIPGEMFKNCALLLISCLFFAWNNPVSLILLLLMISWNYVTVLNWEKCSTKKKTFHLVTSILLNLSILCLYKYTNVVIEMLNSTFTLHLREWELALPLGLSYFTFSSISYLLDVYKGRAEIQHNFIEYALYISFFGKIGMGPIVPYHDMEQALSDHLIDSDLLSKGLSKFVRGLVKKVLLADQLGLIVSNLNSNQSVLGAWLLMIGYTLQLYFDFSGYSDMAIGIGNMFGFDWKENFDHPYCANGIRDFWKRWHISLSNWFQEYLYIPMGGSKSRYIFNILFVWLCTGLWHGVTLNFIIWALFNGVFIIVEKKLLNKFIEKHPIITHIYTIFIVIIGWTIFRSTDISTVCDTLMAMFGMKDGLFDNLSLFTLQSYFTILVLGILFSTNLYYTIESYLTKRFRSYSILINIILYFGLFLLCVACMIGNTYQAFLYFAF